MASQDIAISILLSQSASFLTTTLCLQHCPCWSSSLVIDQGAADAYSRTVSRCRNSMLWWPLRRSLLLPRLQPWFILICLRGISHASVSNFRLLFFDTIPSFSFWSKAVCQLQLSNSERASFQWIPPDRLHNLNNQLWSETDICNHDDIFFTLDKVCFASRKKSALAEGDITIYAQTNFRL